MSNRRLDQLAKYHLNLRMVLLGFVLLFGSNFLASGLNPTGGTWSSNGGQLLAGYDPGVSGDGLAAGSSNPKYVVGTDGSLWLSRLGTWYNLGGQVTSNPCVLRDYARWDHVFVRGTDGHLWDRRVDTLNITATEAPGNWIDLGGYIKAGTSPATSHDAWWNNYNGATVQVRGGDDGLWGKAIQVTTRPVQSNFIELAPAIQGPWVSLGGKILGSPDVSNTINVVYTAVRGFDNALWINEWTPTTLQSTWYSFGGVLASDPSLHFDQINDYYIDAYVKGTDGALWANEINSGTMTGRWIGLGGQISGTSSPATSSTVYDYTTHVFVRGTDNGLWDCVIPARTWYNLGGYITSKPETLEYFYNQVNVFVRGGDGALWNYSYIKS